MLIFLRSAASKQVIHSKLKKRMASNCMSFFCVALVNILLMIAVLNSTPVGAAEEFKVGDAQGWHEPDLNHTHTYSLWASRRKFRVGDSLRFEYKNDSVLVVDKWAYYHCNSSNPISVFNDGNTVITLDKPGPMYFVSGDPDHCEDGQRLLIEVLELHHKSHSPPAMGTPTKPYSEMAPAPSPLPNSGVKVLETVFSLSMASTVAAFIAFLIA